MPNSIVMELAEHEGLNFDDAASLSAAIMTELSDFEDDDYSDDCYDTLDDDYQETYDYQEWDGIAA